jgi:hypothetical protein
MITMTPRERVGILATLDRQERTLRSERETGRLSTIEVSLELDAIRRKMMSVSLSATIESKKRMIEENERQLGVGIAPGMSAGPTYTLQCVLKVQIVHWRKEIEEHHAVLRQLELSPADD